MVIVLVLVVIVFVLFVDIGVFVEISFIGFEGVIFFNIIKFEGVCFSFKGVYFEFFLNLMNFFCLGIICVGLFRILDDGFVIIVFFFNLFFIFIEYLFFIVEVDFLLLFFDFLVFVEDVVVLFFWIGVLFDLFFDFFFVFLILVWLEVDKIVVGSFIVEVVVGGIIEGGYLNKDGLVFEMKLNLGILSFLFRLMKVVGVNDKLMK